MKTRRFALAFATIFAALITLPGVAHAWPWELRLPLGYHKIDPTLLNQDLVSDLKISHALSFGADFVVFPTPDAYPALKDWGIGLRFDSISAYESTDEFNTDAIEAVAQTFSLMLQRRWEFDRTFIAPFVTVGLYSPAVVNYNPANAGRTQYKAERVRSYSAGIEAGWILDVYIIAAEVGYQYLKLDQLRTDDGSPLLTSDGDEKSADMKGPYFKFLLGLHFD